MGSSSNVNNAHLLTSIMPVNNALCERNLDPILLPWAPRSIRPRPGKHQVALTEVRESDHFTRIRWLSTQITLHKYDIPAGTATFVACLLQPIAAFSHQTYTQHNPVDVSHDVMAYVIVYVTWTEEHCTVMQQHIVSAERSWMSRKYIHDYYLWQKLMTSSDYLTTG